MTKIKKQPADTIKEFLDGLVEHAKLQAVAGQDVAVMLLAVVSEMGQLTREISLYVDQVLKAIDKEMAGKTPAEATPLAYRLRGKAEAYGHIAGQISAMVKRLEERKNETVH